MKHQRETHLHFLPLEVLLRVLRIPSGWRQLFRRGDDTLSLLPERRWLRPTGARSLAPASDPKAQAMSREDPCRQSLIGFTYSCITAATVTRATASGTLAGVRPVYDGTRQVIILRL
jgi:hypothetical protein